MVDLGAAFTSSDEPFKRGEVTFVRLKIVEEGARVAFVLISESAEVAADDRNCRNPCLGNTEFDDGVGAVDNDFDMCICYLCFAHMFIALYKTCFVNRLLVFVILQKYFLILKLIRGLFRER